MNTRGIGHLYWWDTRCERHFVYKMKGGALRGTLRSVLRSSGMKIMFAFMHVPCEARGTGELLSAT